MGFLLHEKFAPPFHVCARAARHRARANHQDRGPDADRRREENLRGHRAEIWGLAEVGYKETQSTALLQAQLKSEGFDVQAGVAEMPTAFIASYGTGHPIIGILGEFDALPGVSQAAVPERQPRPGVDSATRAAITCSALRRWTPRSRSRIG